MSVGIPWSNFSREFMIRGLYFKLLVAFCSKLRKWKWLPGQWCSEALNRTGIKKPWRNSFIITQSLGDGFKEKMVVGTTAKNQLTWNCNAQPTKSLRVCWAVDSRVRHRNWRQENSHLKTVDFSSEMEVAARRFFCLLLHYQVQLSDLSHVLLINGLLKNQFWNNIF